MTGPDRIEERILVLAPRGRDAAVVEQVLGRSGEAPVAACTDASAWVGCLKAGAGAALVTEEALAEASPAGLFAWLEAQDRGPTSPSSCWPPDRPRAGPSVRPGCSPGSATSSC